MNNIIKIGIYIYY